MFQCYPKGQERPKPFAVKVSREDDEEKKMAHRKEFEITSSLDHPNVVTSIDFFDLPLSGEIPPVLDYIDVIDVLDAIARQENGMSTEHGARHLFKQVLQGIAYLHEHDVAHRDIKPHNILVTPDNKVYLMDFNVSSKKADSKAAFAMMTKTGTVAFSAPEIFTQRVYDEKVDLWSAGIVLFMMLTGRPPFEEESAARLVHQITNMEPNMLDESLRAVSQQGRDLISLLLQKDPESRPSAR